MDVIYSCDNLPTPYNANEFVNWNRLNKYTANTKKQTLTKKIIEKLTPISKTISTPTLLVVRYWLNLRTNADVDNHVFTKGLIDALTKGGIVVDDNVKIFPYSPLYLVEKCHVDEPHCSVLLFDLQNYVRDGWENKKNIPKIKQQNEVWRESFSSYLLSAIKNYK